MDLQRFTSHPSASFNVSTRRPLTEGYRVPLMVGVLSTADRDATPAQQRSVAYPRPPHKAMSRAERLAERLAAEVVGMHYGCPDCPKVFSSAAGLEVHIGMKHQAA